MYIESVNIGTDHETTTFFDYLGISLKDSGGNYEVNTVKGKCAGCTDLLKYYYMGGVSPHYLVDQLEADGAELLLSSEEGNGRIFAHETNNYKVISSSVIMGAISNGDSLNIKPYLLSEFVNYFIGYNPVTSLQENIAKLVQGDVYPNPLRDQTTITFGLSESAHVIVTIYSMDGQVIKKLVDKKLNPGQHAIKWDTTDENLGFIGKGFYLCRIQSGNETATQKLIVLP